MKSNDTNPLGFDGEVPSTRRQFINSGSQQAAGVVLGGLLPSFARAADVAAVPTGAPLSGQKKFAKSVIHINLIGKLSQFETFDPKTGLTGDYACPNGGDLPISTNVPGIEISANFPMLAKLADRYALLRSVTKPYFAGHPESMVHALTGRYAKSQSSVSQFRAGGIVHPLLGGVVSYFKGYAGGYKGALPPFISLPGYAYGWPEGGFLGRNYNSYQAGYDVISGKEKGLVEGGLAPDPRITGERQQDRSALLNELDRLGREQAEDPLVKTMDGLRKDAFSLFRGEAGKVFDLSQESAAVRERFGSNTVPRGYLTQSSKMPISPGQACLLALRLVKQGVPFVSINWMGWDWHHFTEYTEMTPYYPALDRGLSALLEGLEAEGLLDTTIVWVASEMGVTTNTKTAGSGGSRNHNTGCSSQLIAGGGFTGGVVVGKSDPFRTKKGGLGSAVAERPILSCDVLDSIYTRLGIAPDSKLPMPDGTLACLSPRYDDSLTEEEKKTSDTGILKEIM